MTTRDRRRRHLELIRALAAHQGGVVTRSQVYAAGLSRGEVRAHLRGGRWKSIGRHCVILHGGAVSDDERLWSAILEGGPRAILDGASALVAAGLKNFSTPTIRVSVPRGARIRHRGTSADIRQTRRWCPDDAADCPLPRTRPAVAAIRAALWARSDREAALVLTMTVQQGLTTIEELSLEMLRVRRDRRRTFLHGLLIDLAGGVGSLNELDVLDGCRTRGLPRPDTQVLRRTEQGTFYLDLRWQHWGVVVEVDGIQHGWVQNAVADAIRHNAIAVDGDIVLRLPVLGLRVCPDQFFAQIREALQRRGWPGTSYVG